MNYLVLVETAFQSGVILVSGGLICGFLLYISADCSCAPYGFLFSDLLVNVIRGNISLSCTVCMRDASGKFLRHLRPV